MHIEIFTSQVFSLKNYHKVNTFLKLPLRFKKYSTTSILEALLFSPPHNHPPSSPRGNSIITSHIKD